MFIDIILYKIACMIWPDKPAVTKGSAEDSANWIILDDLHRSAGSSGSEQSVGESDPYLNGDYHDGPDW